MSLFSVSDHPEVDRLVETCGYAAAALTILPIPGSEIIGVMPLHVGMVIGIAHHRGRTLTRDSATSLLLQIGGTVGLSLVGSRLATTAAKFVLPGLGGLIAAPFMYASTLAIGAVADAFFRSEGNLSQEEMREVYRKTVSNAKSSFRPEKMREKAAMDQASSAVTEGASAGVQPEGLAREKASTEGASAGVQPEGLAREKASTEGASAPAAPTPAAPESPADKLRSAKELLDQGLISQDEFDEVKKRVLDSFGSSEG